MKKTLALLCALVMALSILPAISFAEDAGDINPDHNEVNMALSDVDFTGVTATADGGSGVPSTSSKKFFTISLSEASGMFAAEWMIDYPEEYVSITAESSTWSGGIISQINSSWDDEEATSDKFASVVNIEYVGQSGGEPRGIEGNKYIRGGNYLMSGSFAGVQMGGPFHRFAYRLDVTPPQSACEQDATGWYLPVDLTITEFEYMIYVGGSPKASGACADPNETGWFVNDYLNPQYVEWLSDTDGKIYVNPVAGEEPTIVTEYFYVDGELYTTVEHEEGADWTMPEYTPAEGYTFSGWTMTEEHVYVGTTELIPPVIVTEYFYVDGELYTTVEHEEGADWEMPVYTPAEGYNFSGWTLADDGNYYGTTAPKSYQLAIYYLKDTTGGAIANAYFANVPYGETYTVESPVIEGWHLVDPEQAVITGVMPAANVEIDVYYTEDEIPMVTEYFYIGSELYTTVEHEEGAEWAMPADPTAPEGYTFTGWTLIADHMYYGEYEQIMVTITIVYQYQDGDVIDTVEYQVPYGEAYSYESPIIDGYIAEPQTVTGVATEDYTVHVNYAPVPYYHVVIHFVDKYDLNDELYEAIEGTYANGYVINFEYPVIEGYTYEQQGQPGTCTVTGDAEILIKYEPNLYPLTIIYQYEDGTQAAEPYTAEILYKRDYSVDSPVIEGYTADYPVVNGTMVIGGETIYVTYYANPYTITVHLVDEDGNPVGEDIITVVPYGEDYEIELPDIDGYETPDNPTGVCTGDDEITVVYTAAYEPVPPTVEGTKAELRDRATEDSYKDLRFIFTVNFNDSYITYKNKNYGPTTLYYQIIEFYSMLRNESGKEAKVKGTNIFTMYEDANGEEDTNVFTYTAVLRGVKEENFDKFITATPYITYTMDGVTTTVDGPALEASVNSAAN